MKRKLRGRLRQITYAMLAPATVLGAVVLALCIVFGLAIPPVWRGVLVAVLGLALFCFFRFAFVPLRRFFSAILLLEQNSKNKDTTLFDKATERNPLFTEVKSILDDTYADTIYTNQAEISMLQSQINPHFLYNTLDSIRGQAMDDGAKDLAEMIEALGTFFRYSISHRGNIVTLEEELKNVDNYILIQRFRFFNRFRLEKDIEDYEQVRDCRLPKLTFQPIIENAISHGLESKVEDGIVSIRISATPKVLTIHIEDNGVGMPPEKVDEINQSLSGKSDTLKSPHSGEGRGNGIALGNVNSRIKLNFGNDYGIHLYASQGAGTTVEIRLPVSKDDRGAAPPATEH